MTMSRVESQGVVAVLERQGWLRTSDVAEYLGTSPNNIRNMIYRKYLKPRRFAGRWYFSKSEIDRLILSGR